jgi:hypothetical protein
MTFRAVVRPGCSPGVKEQKRGVDHSFHLLPRLRMVRSQASMSPYVFMVCFLIKYWKSFKFPYMIMYFYVKYKSVCQVDNLR